VRQLKIISGKPIEIPDSTFELVDEIYFVAVPDRAGILREMKGPEIVAALRGIVNTTTLCALSPEDKAIIRRILQTIDLCLCSPTYNWNAPS